MRAAHEPLLASVIARQAERMQQALTELANEGYVQLEVLAEAELSGELVLERIRAG